MAEKEINPPEVKKKGWGSFHSEREDEKVEVLMGKSDKEYKAPTFPIDVSSANRYPIVGTTSDSSQEDPHMIPFGSAAKKQLFYLTEEFTFLNHGAFGAALRPVVETARLWADHMESQPLRFVDRELLPLLVHITRRMAKFINVKAQDMILLPNVTTGLNTILRSLNLSPGDRVLTLSTGYGATKKIVQYVCEKTGAIADQLFVPLPLPSKQALIGQLRRYLRKYASTEPPKHAKPEELENRSMLKVIIIDAVNSNSGLKLPVEELTQLCQSFGIKVLIDGAHALGSMPLDVEAIGCDYFVANAHKWLCSSKGCAVMYVKREHQSSIVPMTISHGYGSGFTSSFIWMGLQDYGPWLSLHACLDFYERCNPAVIYQYINSTVTAAAHSLAKAWGTEVICPDSFIGPMACIRLPGPRVPRDGREANEIQDRLYFQYKIEVPIKMLENRLYVRISAHIHNSSEEFQKLADAMLQIRPKFLTEEEDQEDLVHFLEAVAVEAESSCG